VGEREQNTSLPWTLAAGVPRCLTCNPSLKTKMKFQPQSLSLPPSISIPIEYLFVVGSNIESLCLGNESPVYHWTPGGGGNTLQEFADTGLRAIDSAEGGGHVGAGGRAGGWRKTLEGAAKKQPPSQGLGGPVRFVCAMPVSRSRETIELARG